MGVKNLCQEMLALLQPKLTQLCYPNTISTEISEKSLLQIEEWIKEQEALVLRAQELSNRAQLLSTTFACVPPFKSSALDKEEHHILKMEQINARCEDFENRYTQIKMNVYIDRKSTRESLDQEEIKLKEQEELSLRYNALEKKCKQQGLKLKKLSYPLKESTIREFEDNIEFTIRWNSKIEDHNKILLSIFHDRVPPPKAPFSPQDITEYIKKTRPLLRISRFVKVIFPAILIFGCIIWLLGNYLQNQYILWKDLKSIKHSAEQIDWIFIIPTPPFDEQEVQKYQKEAKEILSLYEKTQDYTQARERYEINKLLQPILIPKGSFTMGCKEKMEHCHHQSQPSHKVQLTQDFFIMKTEVTRDLFGKIIGGIPRIQHDSSSITQVYITTPPTQKTRDQDSFKHELLSTLLLKPCAIDCPINYISWVNAARFANALNRKLDLEECYQITEHTDKRKVLVKWSDKQCTGWRIPTEAEWEYAARGQSSMTYAGSSTLDNVGWYENNSNKSIQPVCSLQLNHFGLCDMSGNVAEWTWDYWDWDYGRDSQVSGQSVYSEDTRIDPIIEPPVNLTGDKKRYLQRTLRSGEYYNNTLGPTVYYRSHDYPTQGYSRHGFRLLRRVP